ncbi:MAG TPA: cation-transporting P-type ATPase, partial [Oleiagrimonas sp.]|nr:cation-transporting P-type ATPase [Oleiagrimonas sp.]
MHSHDHTTHHTDAAEADGAHAHEHALSRIDAARIAMVAVGALVVWLWPWQPWPRVSVVGILALVIGGWPIFREALENIAARRMTMELSMTIAIAAAAGLGQYLTALIITLFVLVAEVLEG